MNELIGVSTLTLSRYLGFSLVAIIIAIAVFYYSRMLLRSVRWKLLRGRARAIRRYQFPEIVFTKFAKQHQLTLSENLSRLREALYSVFLIRLYAQDHPVSLESKTARELWRNFVSTGSVYAEFCSQVFRSHIVDYPLQASRDVSDRARATAWLIACKLDRVSPYHPSRIPAVYTIDSELGIDGGILLISDRNDEKGYFYNIVIRDDHNPQPYRQAEYEFNQIQIGFPTEDGSFSGDFGVGMDGGDAGGGD